MGILSQLFKHCSCSNYIMWLAILMFCISGSSLWYYKWDKARDEKEQEEEKLKAQKLNTQTKTHQQPEVKVQASTVPQDTKKQSNQSNKTDSKSTNVKSEVTKQPPTKKEEDILEQRRAQKTDLLMKMSQDHRIEEEPHLEDQSTQRNSPVKSQKQAKAKKGQSQQEPKPAIELVTMKKIEEVQQQPVKKGKKHGKKEVQELEQVVEVAVVEKEVIKTDDQWTVVAQRRR
ncbi:UNKNOWN [Stylonychia lemnae]|uniref:Uncharacterized protein n=1 Tax=Stylonychia lemnae TaxID=5949 RepID=A0A078AZR3_STYLE|nr:UNKNOWN [Stylonychia lemnae]|eukprot:CDW87704.1 UNKNOWN [Stylonychia lemnae]